MKRKLSIIIAFFIFLPSLVFAGGQIQPFDHDLYYGLEDDDGVTELQTFLSEKGLYKGPINGNYFSLTKKAVQQLQKEMGNESTGYFGKKTRTLVNDSLPPMQTETSTSTLQDQQETASTTETTNDPIDSLSSRVDELEAKISDLESEIESLKNQIASMPSSVQSSSASALTSSTQTQATPVTTSIQTSTSKKH